MYVLYHLCFRVEVQDEVVIYHLISLNQLNSYLYLTKQNNSSSYFGISPSLYQIKLSQGGGLYSAYIEQ